MSPRPRRGVSRKEGRMVAIRRWTSVYASLRAILQTYGKRLNVDFDRPQGFSLSGPVHTTLNKPMFFGAV